MSHPFIEHLKEDHERQRNLGERVKSAKDPKERRALGQEMYKETYPHMMGEEGSIFPYMEESGDEEAKDQALEAIQEHHVGKVLFRELFELNPENEAFKPKAVVLDEINRQHMDEEETFHFPWLEQHASDEQLDRLYAAYEEAEKRAKEE